MVIIIDPRQTHYLLMLHNHLRLTQLTIDVKSAIFSLSTGRYEKVGLSHVRTSDRPQSR
jgi:hypothetical protein